MVINSFKDGKRIHLIWGFEQMLRIVFLILNYNNYLDTISCIESIDSLNLSKKDISIVIVDNGSEDGSSEILRNKYNGIDYIIVLSLNQNVGFSQGNNAGYKYIREHLNSEFVVVTNNDVLFPQVDLYQRLKMAYEESNFYLLGPDIFVRRNKEHQSPIMRTLPSKELFKKELDMYRYYLGNPKKWAFRRYLQNTKNKIYCNNRIFRMTYDLLKKRESINKSIIQENVCIQGACIILSNPFLVKEEKLFTPETFLYCEEILLFYRCLSLGYKILYDPRIQVWHEDSSTMRKLNRNAVDRARFTLMHHVESREIVFKEIYKVVK